MIAAATVTSVAGTLTPLLIPAVLAPLTAWLLGRRKTKADTADMIANATGKVVAMLTAQLDAANARAAAETLRADTAEAELRKCRAAGLPPAPAS